MTRERGGPDVCPLRCQRRLAEDSDQADRVDWAGLPVNLDLVFSQQQLDKVYMQYLTRRPGTRQWRWSRNGAPRCACELAAHDGRRSAAEGITAV
ncbi:hypothetical protein [Mycobacterium sp. Marseille-P9652]|uniref:hypothetical protein n=1 Tax=Mycobacterium sp. Marseille-P9652 TaxID=2654950 RepID=UPI001E5BFBAC|nr:hypothetical protein [Mycobacterium sp. Marseille-P9652]